MVIRLAAREQRHAKAQGQTMADDHQEDGMNAYLSNAAGRGVREGSENGNILLFSYVSDAVSPCLSNVQLRPHPPPKMKYSGVMNKELNSWISCRRETQGIKDNVDNTFKTDVSDEINHIGDNWFVWFALNGRDPIW